MQGAGEGSVDPVRLGQTAIALFRIVLGLGDRFGRVIEACSDLRRVELLTWLGFETHSDHILARLKLQRRQLVVLVRRARALSVLALPKSFKQPLLRLADISHLDQDRRLTFVKLFAGRPVPRWLVLGPVFGIAGGLTAYLGMTLVMLAAATLNGTWVEMTGSLPLAFFWVAVPAYFVWGLGLGAAAQSYYQVTRPRCRVCCR